MSESGTSRRNVLKHGALITAGAVGLAGCSGQGDQDATTTPSGGGPVTVEVGPGGNYVFRPGTGEALHVDVGTTVKWVWKSDTHNIVVGSQPSGASWEGTPGDSSKTYDQGYTYEHEFTVAGQYHYWCQPHKQLGMTADLVVEE